MRLRGLARGFYAFGHEHICRARQEELVYPADPARPTFDRDFNEAEGKLMEEHFHYWKELHEQGVCQFGGPVLDPRGVFGVLALWSADEAEAHALADADPSVKAGVMRFEVAEMRVAYPAARG